MPDYGKIIFTLLFISSSYFCAHSIYLHKKGKVVKRLQELNNRSTMTKLLVEEYKHFFKLKWWHWLSWAVFVTTFTGLIFDSN